VADATSRAFYQSVEGREVTHQGWTSLQPTTVASVSLLLNTVGLLAGTAATIGNAAGVNTGVVAPADANARYVDDLWGLLGPQADVADTYHASMTDGRLDIPITPGERAILQFPVKLGAMTFGHDEQGRTTAPAFVVRLYRGFVPLLGTQVSPMLTQGIRGAGTQDTFAESVLAVGAGMARVMRLYPLNPQQQMERAQREETDALRAIVERREQQNRSPSR
jgi:hypothetical protein